VHAGCNVGSWASANDDGQLDGKVVGQLSGGGVSTNQVPEEQVANVLQLHSTSSPYSQGPAVSPEQASPSVGTVAGQLNGTAGQVY
jgi:hypothetical protein